MNLARIKIPWPDWDETDWVFGLFIIVVVVGFFVLIGQALFWDHKEDTLNKRLLAQCEVIGLSSDKQGNLIRLHYDCGDLDIKAFIKEKKHEMDN
jgi:hypothetical protein